MSAEKLPQWQADRLATLQPNVGSDQPLPCGCPEQLVIDAGHQEGCVERARGAS